MSDFNLELGLMPVIATPYPVHVLMESGTDAFGITAPGSKIEWILQVEKTGLLSELGFRYSTTLGVSSTVPPPTQRISLQTVDLTTGHATGSIQTSATFTPQHEAIDGPGVTWNGTWQWVNVPSASVVAGQLIAIVIEYSSGTIGPPNSYYNGIILNSSNGIGGNFPYVWAKGSRHTDRLIVGYKVDGRAYGWPIEQLRRPGYNAGEKALRFQFDGEWCDSYRIAGCTWQGQHAGSTGQQYSVRLYDGTTEIARTTVDGDHSHLLGENSLFHTILFDEGTLPTLLPDRPYRLAIAPDVSTTEITLDTYYAASGGDAVAFPGGNQFFLSERDSTSDSWSDSGEARPMIDLIISEWGAPAQEVVGIHLKFTPALNDPYFIQHADDQIERNLIEIPEGINAHEFPGVPIGNAIESYSGWATVEVFKDPDVDFSAEFLIHAEQPIEELKFLRWQPWETGTFQIVFRLRSKEGSSNIILITRYVRILLTGES